MNATPNPPSAQQTGAFLRQARSLVLIGMPGSGKSSVGRKLAHKLGLPFCDSDIEIEKAADMKIEDIFAKHGEPFFREKERQVIARLLSGPACVLSTGGGAFMDEATRRLIGEKAISVWLKADFTTLFERVSRATHRPLLKKPDPAAALRELQERREPVFATATLVVLSDNRPPDNTADRVIAALGAMPFDKASTSGESA